MGKSIKKYQSVHPQNTALTFDIKRMETLYEKFEEQADEPHRHDYFIILLVAQAKGKHQIDFHEFELKAKQVFFISPGQVHQIIEEEKSIGYVLTFSPQFMVENGIESWFFEDLHLFQDYGYTPPLEVADDVFKQLKLIAEEIFSFVHSDKKLKYQAVGALLKLFLIHCNNSCTKEEEGHPQRVQASVTLLRNFKSLLNTSFERWHKVSQYAQALHITSDHLNNSVKSLTGKSAKEHIQSRIITAAKRMLLHSDMSHKAIAYELGFSEPANFSQFFKKCTGQSPSRFTTQIRK